MAIVKLKVFVNVTGSGFMTGLLSPEQVTLRSFGSKDKISWEIKLLERQADLGYAAPFVVVPVADLALQMGIGHLGATILCTQAAWAYDGTANVITGVLDLNTPAMQAEFTDAAVEMIFPYLDIRISDADGSVTPIHVPVKIFRALPL